MPNHLVLVRHGMSEGNVANQMAREGNYDAFNAEFYERPGRDWRLVEVGVDQAKEAGLWIGKFILGAYPELEDGFDIYYTSPHARTRETAGHLAIAGAEWRKERRIRERDWGDIETMNKTEWPDKFPDNYRKRQIDPLYWQPPGGESIAQVADTRVRAMNNTLRQRVERGLSSAIYVTHGEYIWAEFLDKERMGHEEWDIAEADASRRIKNCQIIHFTRLDPETGEQAPVLAWVRSVTPWETPDNPGQWREIDYKKYSNQELLAEVAAIRPLDLPGAQQS